MRGIGATAVAATGVITSVPVVVVPDVAAVVVTAVPSVAPAVAMSVVAVASTGSARPVPPSIRAT